MINQAGRSSCDGTFPVSLINICAYCEPSARCHVDFMPLPSRSTSADLPVVLDTALLLCSFLLPAAKETRSGCLCPGDCAPRGNVRALHQYLVHYNQGRPHLSLGPGIPEAPAVFPALQGRDGHSFAQDCKVVDRAVLGGLLP